MAKYAVGDRVRVRRNYEHYSGEKIATGVIFEKYDQTCIRYDLRGWDDLTSVTVLEVLASAPETPPLVTIVHVAEVGHMRFERRNGEDKVSVFVEEEATGSMSLDQFREVAKIIEGGR